MTFAVITDGLTLDRRYEWVIRLWPILSPVMTVSSRRHNDVCGFLPSTGLIENGLFVGVLSHESCHSSMHSLDICGKKLSGEILLWVMTERIPSLAALSAISFPYIPTWLKNLLKSCPARILLQYGASCARLRSPMLWYLTGAMAAKQKEYYCPHSAYTSSNVPNVIEDVQNCLSEAERAQCRELRIIYTEGKRGRKVPVREVGRWEVLCAGIIRRQSWIEEGRVCSNTVESTVIFS